MTAWMQKTVTNLMRFQSEYNHQFKSETGSLQRRCELTAAVMITCRAKIFSHPPMGSLAAVVSFALLELMRRSRSLPLLDSPVARRKTLELFLREQGPPVQLVACQQP